VRGPDNAAARLSEIAKWYDEVTAAGGYRAYYDGTREGTLQGGGTAGGLGADQEFFESLLLPQILFDGFLGFTPTATGFKLNPALPAAWPEYTVTRIRFQDSVLSVHATKGAFEIEVLESATLPAKPALVSVDSSKWKPTEAAGTAAEGRWNVALPMKGETLRFVRP